MYRNLEVLSEQGFIKTIILASNQKRFDINRTNHYHIRCTVCNRVDDAPIETDKKLEDTIRSLTDYKINRA